MQRYIPAQKPLLLQLTRDMVGASDPSLHASPTSHSRGYQRSFVFMRQTSACTRHDRRHAWGIRPARLRDATTQRTARAMGDVNQKQYACHSLRAREIYRRHSSGIGGPPLPCCAAVKRRAACCAAVSSLDLTAHTRPHTRALSHLIPTIHTPVSYESLNKMRYICIKIVFAIVSWWRYLDSLDWEEQIIHKLFCTKVGRCKG
jgi:hypothetical protein